MRSFPGDEVMTVPDRRTGPARGSMVTFLLRDEGGERFRVGEVIGPMEADPVTEEFWVGVRMSAGRRRVVSLIPLADILNITPPGGLERGAA